jgi:signal transduction histidine kinase
MLSLRQKLVLSHLGLVVLAMALTGLYVLHQMEQFYLEQLQDQLIVQAELLAEDAADSLLTGDFESLRQTLRTLDQETAMRVRVVDAGGRLVAATEVEDLPLLGQPVAAPGLEAALRGERTMARIEGESGPEVVYLAVPVLRDGVAVGAVRVAYALQDIADVVDGLRRALLIGLGGVGVVTVAIALFLAASLAAPARQLAQAARQLAAGDLTTRCAERGRDEVAAAAHAFDEMAARLQDYEAARQELLAAVAHDLHSGTMALERVLEALGRGASTNPAFGAELLPGMRGHTRRLGRLADDLLQTARLEAGSLTLERERVDPAVLLRQCAAEFAADAAERQVTLAVDAQPTLPRLYADPARLGQALANLVENALRHAPTGSIVRLCAETGEGTMTLTVMDSGPGLGPDTPELDGSRRHRHPGRPGRLGLGLTIARRFAEAHGGRLEAVNPLHGGACFALILPTLSPARTKATAPSDDLPARSAARRALALPQAVSPEPDA